MTTKVNLPGGRALYVQTDDPQAAAKAAKLFLDKEAAQSRVESERGVMQNVDDRVRAVARGVPFVGGGMDEASAFLNTAGGLAGDYDTELAYQRARDADYDKRHPKESVGEQIGGAVAGTIAGARTLGRMGIAMPASLAGKVAVGIPTGAAMGGTQKFLEGEGGPEKRLEGVPAASAVGGIAGMAAPILGKAVGAGINALTKAAPPTVEALKQFAQTAYKKADEAGLRLTQHGFARGLDEIGQAVIGPLNKTIHPKTYATLLEMYGWRGSTPTLSQVDQLRQIAGQAAMSGDRADARLARMVVDKIDDFMAKLGPNDVAAGNRKQAVEQITNARKLWQQTRKAETIQNMFEKAENNARSSTYENALRIEFKNLANNPKRFNAFSPDEKRAILQVVRGTKTEKVLSYIGKAAPKGIISAGLSPAIGGALGSLVGGPAGAAIGAAALPAVGAAAKQSAAAIARNSAKSVDELVRSGGEAAEGPASALARKLTEALMIGQSGEAGEKLAPVLPSLSGPISMRQ